MKRWFMTTKMYLKKYYLLLFTVILFISFLCVSVSSAKPNDAVAKVNDVVLTEKEVEEVMNELIPQASFHGGINQEKRESFRPKALEILIERELFYQEAKNRGMKVDKKRIDALEEKTIKRLGGKKKFKEALRLWGRSREDYRERLERIFLIEDIRRVEIDEKSTISPEEIKRYYEENRKGFFSPPSRRIRHILIKVAPSSTTEEKEYKKKVAEDVLRKLKAGEDFAEIAWDYSDDPYRVKGGDLGLLHEGRLDPSLDEVAFKLSIGEISNIVETIYGYHIMRVEEIKGAYEMSLDEVSAKIERKLKDRRLKALKEAFVSLLKAKAKIEVYYKQ